MNTKIGRNDLCFCGSGEKYKKCCLPLTPTRNMPEETIDFGWRKLRQLEGFVCDQHLAPYATQDLPDEVMKCAIVDFFPSDDLPEGLDKEVLFNHLFIPWFLYDWIPDDNFEMENFDPDMTVAQNYVKNHGNVLNSETKFFISAMSRTYYSFYSIYQVEKDKSLLVKDILLGTTHEIKERLGTYQLTRGDIVYSRVLSMNNQSIFLGMAPVMIPAVYHNDILDFKEWLIEKNEGKSLTPEILRNDFDLELISYFFELMQIIYNRPMPTLANTDGDLLQFSKSHFKLTIAPEEALKYLLPLMLSDDPEEFLQDAKRTSTGEIKEIEFPWLKKGNKIHKSWDTTVLGHIRIKQGKLILETNSEKRTQKGKKLLIKYLGEAISFQQTLIESVEQKMRSLPASKPENNTKKDEFMATPEVQKHLRAMATAYWESWFDEPIPALDNQTPRQAAKTEKGRERLDALLLMYERHDLENSDNLFKADISYLKSELSLI